MSKNLLIQLPTEEETVKVAMEMARCIQTPLLMTFRGEIGAGKTTFIRAMLRAIGVKSAIKSPTFSLVESYLVRDLHIHHFDLYRIHDEEELDYIGFRDYFGTNALCCIEWPEHGASYLTRVDIEFSLKTLDKGRKLEIIASSAIGRDVISCLEAML